MLLAMKTRDVIRAIRSVYRHSLTVVNCSFFRKSRHSVREGTFFYWGGGGGAGWAGASEGRVLSKFFTNWGGSNLFYSQPGEGHSFFGKEKITPCFFYFVYTSKATSQE